MARRGKGIRGKEAAESSAHRAQVRRLKRMSDEEIKSLPQEEFDRLTAGISVDETSDAVLRRIISEETTKQAEEFNKKLIAEGGPNLIEDGFSVAQIREIESSLTEDEKSSPGKTIDAAAKYGRAIEFREIMSGQGFDLEGMGYNLVEVSSIRDGIEQADRDSGGKFIDKAIEYFESEESAKSSAADPSPRSGPTEASSGGGIADWFSPKAWYDWMYEDTEAKPRRLDDRPASPSPTPKGTPTASPSVSSSPDAFAEPQWLCDLFGNCGITYSRSYNKTIDETTYNITGAAGNTSQIVVSGPTPFPPTVDAARRDSALWSTITDGLVDCVIASPLPTPAATPSSTPTQTPSSTPTPFAVDGWVYSLWRQCGINPDDVRREHEVRTINGTATEVTTFTRTNPDSSIVRLELEGNDPFSATESEFRDESGIYASSWSAMRTWMGNCIAASNSPSPAPSVSASPSANVTVTPTPSVSGSPSANVTVTPFPSSTPSVSASPSPGWYIPGVPDWFNQGLNGCANAIADVFGASTPSDTSDDTVRLNITRSDGSGNSTIVDVGNIDDIPGSRANATGLSWLDKAIEADPACFPVAAISPDPSVSPFPSLDPSPSGSPFPSINATAVPIPAGNETIPGKSSSTGSAFPAAEVGGGSAAGVIVAGMIGYGIWRARRAMTRTEQIQRPRGTVQGPAGGQLAARSVVAELA